MLFHEQIAPFIEINDSQAAAADSEAVLQHKLQILNSKIWKLRYFWKKTQLEKSSQAIFLVG